MNKLLKSLLIRPFCSLSPFPCPPRFLDLWARKHGLAGEQLKILRLICCYIVGVYYKQWFAIKRNYRLTDGARHLLKQVGILTTHIAWLSILLFIHRYIPLL